MRSREAGFTLIEVLVAISILGMSLVLIFSIFSQGLKAIQIDKAYSTAVILAKSKMDEIDLVETLEAGEEEGTVSGGFQWRRVVAELPEDLETVSERRNRLYNIRVVVSWQKGQKKRQVVLETLRTTIKPEWRRIRL
jgi:general secretion pathway protein I